MTKNKTPSFKVFERWGCGGRKAFFKKFSSPTKKQKQTKKTKTKEAKNENSNRRTRAERDEQRRER